MKTSNNAPVDTVGYDAGKKIKGRERHIAVDTLGLLVALGLSTAGLQECCPNAGSSAEHAASPPTAVPSCAAAR